MSRWLLCLAGFVAAVLFTPASGWAHRFGGPNDPCERKISTSLLHITLYQPQFDPDAEYCDEVPREGNTVIVVDMLGDELRKLPVGLDVYETGDSVAVRSGLSIPPKTYRRGVVDAQVMLTAQGRYTARVTLGGDDSKPQVLSFPIRVTAWYRAFIVPALIVLGVIGLKAVSVVRYYMSATARRSRRRR